MNLFDLSHDPVGAALLDYSKGNRRAAITVHSELVEHEPILVDYLHRDYKRLPPLEKLALNQCRGKVLDVGAGAGCHSRILQQKGLAVTALDRSPVAVDLMIKNGIKRAVCADIFEYSQGPYDTLLLLMNGIGLVGDLEGLDLFLVHAQSLLTPGGQILTDSSQLGYLFEDEEDQGYEEIDYMLEYQGSQGEWFKWLYVDYEILAAAARAKGYQCQLLRRGEEHDYLARLIRP